MAEYLLPLAEAFQRFMPDVTDVASRTMAYSGLDQFKAGIIEGDVAIDKEGLVLTQKVVWLRERLLLWGRSRRCSGAK